MTWPSYRCGGSRAKSHSDTLARLHVHTLTWSRDHALSCLLIGRLSVCLSVLELSGSSLIPLPIILGVKGIAKTTFVAGFENHFKMIDISYVVNSCWQF